jgi:hypothetical protein
MDSRNFISGAGKVDRSLSGLVSNITSGFAKIGLAAAGVRTVFDALIGPMKEAQEAALAERKLAQVFKSTANAAGVSKDAIMAYAAERQKLTSFDGDETVNAAAVLGSFTNIKGNLFTDALTSAQDLSAFMGQDLQTSVIQIGKALNDPAKGVSALAKAGIQFSESQKEQIKTLQETGQLSKAQAIILKELQTQFGGQAEALVDPIKQAENAWGDFMESVGTIANEKLLPLMPKLIAGFERMSGAVEAAFENVDALFNSEPMKKFLETVERIDAVLSRVSEMTGGLLPESVAEVAAPGVGLLRANAANPKAGGLAGAMSKVASAADGGLGALKASAAAGRKGTAADDAIAGRLFTPKQEADGALMAGQALAGLVRQGLAGLEGGLMSLGKAPGEAGQQNQIGSLEKGSQEAFDVLRANTSGGDKDVAQKQLKAAEKSNENLAKILKVLNDPKSTRKDVNVVLRGID